MNRYPITSTVDLYLTLQVGGAGVTGEAPVAIIQRRTDGYFYNATLLPNKFAAAFATNPMTEVSSTNLPGLYRYSFDSSQDLTGSEYFFVRLMNTGTPAVISDEVIAMGNFHSAYRLSNCNVYGKILNVYGQPEVNQLVRASILPNTILSVVTKPGISVDKIDTYTDINGDFSIDLIQGLIIRLQIQVMGYDRRLTVPATTSANFADL